ncbi:MAG: hypothetical protein WBF20_12185 [Trebonia sp.]|jgi:hypothetical protein|uniref:hypothetical protein n=1 Tax=Trebonia sp. TaxID=2767075 RepID=UPI003BB1D494
MVTPEIVGHIDSPIAPRAVAFRLVSQYADGAPADASSFLPSLGPVFETRFPGQQIRAASLALGGAMGKKLVELLLCILHPVAVVLMWINLVSRTDLTTVGKLAWAIFGLIPLVPFLYVLTGGDLF